MAKSFFAWVNVTAEGHRSCISEAASKGDGLTNDMVVDSRFCRNDCSCVIFQSGPNQIPVSRFSGDDDSLTLEVKALFGLVQYRYKIPKIDYKGLLQGVLLKLEQSGKNFPEMKSEPDEQKHNMNSISIYPAEDTTFHILSNPNITKRSLQRIYHVS